jgi:hypothetical protein
MSETTSDLSNWAINQVKQLRPEYSDEVCIAIVSDIVKTNFPVCLAKYIRGESWKLP